MEIKKIVWIIVLLTLMWMSVTGQYLEVPELYDSAYLLGFIDLVVTVAIMMVIPFICRLINKERMDFITGKKICKWNSWGMFILSIILTAMQNGERYVGIGGLGALIFYFINKWLFVYDENVVKTVRKNRKSKVEKALIASEEIEEPVKTETKKAKYCKLCGGKLDANNKCKKCGKQYFKFNKSLLLYLIIGILVVLNIVLIILYDDAKKETENTLEACGENSTWCETQMNMIRGDKTIFYVQDKLDFFDNNVVFVLEGYGNYYYTYDCVQKITHGEEYTFWAYNINAAKDNGYQKGTCY